MKTPHIAFTLHLLESKGGHGLWVESTPEAESNHRRPIFLLLCEPIISKNCILFS